MPVTGVTTGIGRAIARSLLSRGVRVLLFRRHERELEDALAELRETGGEVHGITADVARPEDVRRIFSEVPAAPPDHL